MLRNAGLVFAGLLLLGAESPAATWTYSHIVTSPVSGVYGVPFSAFSIPLSNGAQVNWLEVGSNTSCPSQSSARVGFIFLTLSGQTESPCAPLVGAPSATSGDFQGVDARGRSFTGTYTFVITTAYKCGGGRGGGCHTVFTIQSGTVTITI